MRKLIARQEGQQVIIFALLLPVILACLGLVVDVGNVYVHRRRVQTAADAAASAAGMVLAQQGASAARTVAFTYALRNGYNNDGTTNIVTVSSPPTSGNAAYVGNSRYIQVQIQDNVRPYFAGLIWRGAFAVRGRATAGFTYMAVGADVIVLKDSNASPCNATTTATGNRGKLYATAGTVWIDSPCASALSFGNSDIYAGAVNVVGGWVPGSTGVISPAPTLNSPPISDPLKNLPTPDSPHNETNCPTRTGPVSGKYLPGVYNSGFSFNFNYVFDGSGGACNGVFIIKGTMNATGGTQTIRLNNAALYFAGSGSSAGLTLGGNGAVEGTAPASGPYQGLLIFAARNNTSMFELHGNPQLTGCSSTLANIKGLVYLPVGALGLKGTSDQCFAGAMIVWTFEMTGNATTTVNVYSGAIPATIATDAMVE